MTPEELKPCPFCGAEAALVKGAVAFDDYEVACDGCGFSGPNFGSLGHEPYPKEDAINHWNTRADLAPAWRPIETLKDHISDRGEFLVFDGIGKWKAWLIDGEIRGHEVDGSELPAPGFPPTHWMRLPAEPEFDQ